MLHIVQVVLWGAAETPRIYGDEAEARAAYVECVRKNWERRYAAYCEHHGLKSDAFESARAFVDTLDPSEKSAVHYWALDAPKTRLREADDALRAEDGEAFRDLTGRIEAAGSELSRLLDDLSGLTGRLAGASVSPAAEQAAGEPEKAAPTPPAPRQGEPEADPATRATPEWQALVGTVKSMGSGSRNDFYLLPREDWRQDVYSDRTSLEYWDWVADRITKYKERAMDSGYSVAEAPEAPGCYRFVTPAGAASEDCGKSEWEAWCAAGLDLEAGSREKAG